MAPEYRHMPLGTLARYAQRIGKVFASATTWSRLVRERDWRRPRQRIHPPKPTVGVRASRPNEIWHIDTSVIKLIDGSKVYLQAAVDNFSHKILAWAVTEQFDPSNTCQVLLAAGKHLVDAGRPLMYADSGVENVNGEVDDTLFSACLDRILATSTTRRCRIQRSMGRRPMKCSLGPVPKCPRNWRWPGATHGQLA